MNNAIYFTGIVHQNYTTVVSFGYDISAFMDVAISSNNENWINLMNIIVKN